MCELNISLNNEKKAWLGARLVKLMNIIKEEVGDGNINDLPYSKHKFRTVVDGCRKSYEKHFSEKLSLEDLFELLGEMRTFELINSGMSESDARKDADRCFGLKLARKGISIEGLTLEVCDYIRNGGKFYGVKAKDLPFFERLRAFKRSQGADDKSFESALKDIEAYYFSSVAPLEPVQKRLQKEDFVYMSMDEFGKARTRSEHIAKLYELASRYAEKDGSIDRVYEDERWSDILSSMELGMTSIEFVSLLFPLDCNFHFKTGRVRANGFDVVRKELADFVRKYGDNNLSSNIRAKDEFLFSKLRNLATTFYEGTISVGELLAMYGYESKVKSVEGSSIDEDKIIEELRLRYSEALDRYFEMNPDASSVDMKEVNRLMDLQSSAAFYTSLGRLARLNGQSIKDYIDGKELFALDKSQSGGLTKKKINGETMPALTYEIHLARNVCEVVTIRDGRECTKTLKQKLMAKMFDNGIINNPQLPQERRFNERVRLAQEVLEEVIGETSSKMATETDEFGG